MGRARASGSLSSLASGEAVSSPNVLWELSRPAGLALLGLLVPLLVLYLLRVRRQPRRVASLLLWQAAERELQARKPFRKLVANVPLALELLALICLALAFAGPTCRGAPRQLGRAVLIVDVSASMGVREGDSSRLGQAREAARSELRRLGPSSEVMILAAGRDTELVSSFERDRSRLEAALGRIVVREEEGRLATALALGADQLRQRGGGRLLVFTDGAVADAESLVAPAAEVDWIQVGKPHDNTAIVRSEVTRTENSSPGRDRVEVFALLKHEGRAPRDVFVTLTLRNTTSPLASRRLTLSPAERAPVVLGFDAGPGDAGQGLELRVSPPDALEADDHVNVRVPASRKLPVVLASKGGSPWLLRALAADRDVELFRAGLESLSTDTVPADALVVIDGACPARVPGTDLLIVNPPPGDCRTARVGATLATPQVTSWTETDPRLRFLSLEQLRVSSARKLELEGARAALVRTREGALIADVSSPGRMGTLLAFDLGDSDWPLQASFVLFIRNITELARAHRAGGSQPGLRTGEPVTLRVPLDVESVDLTYPNGRREAIRVHDGVAIAPPTGHTGFLLAAWAGARPDNTLIPANLASESESQIEPRRLRIAPSPRLAATLTPSPEKLDWLFGALALALIFLDLAWLTRRPRAERPTSGTGKAVSAA